MSCVARFALAIVSTVSFAGYATAELSPDEVWGGFEAYYSELGYAVTADKSVDDDVLRIKNIHLQSSAEPQERVFILSEIGLQDRGDGTVGIICADTMTLTTKTPENELKQDLMFDIDCTSLDIVVSGDQEQFDVKYSGQSLEIAIPEGQALSAGLDDGAGAVFEQLALSLTDLEGQTGYDLNGKERMQTQVLSAKMFRYAIVLSDTENKTSLEQSTVGRDLAFEGKSSVDGTSRDGVEASPGSLLNMMGTYSFGENDTTFSMTDAQSGLSGSLKSSSAKGEISLDPEKILVSALSSDNQLFITKGAPFPIELNVAKMATTLMAPLEGTMAPEPFQFGLELGDVTIADVLWALFDPQEKLPRDPMTLVLNLSGEVTVPAGALGENQPEFDSKQMEINTLNVDELLLRALGTELKGEGQLAFDYSAVESAEAPPIPAGSLGLTLAGANGLLDNLVASGLLPDEQAMGARMMIGLFTRPGAGEDELTSKLEFTPDGQIIANGQRIK